MKFKSTLYTLLASTFVFALVFNLSPNISSAESADCSGTISGKTILSSDTNAGQIDFDGECGGADLKVVGGGTGLAPASKDVAAKISVGSVANTFKIEGYAWNTNAGFVNFSQCPNSWCGVNIEEENGGFRKVSGRAWNEVFGYIYFDDTNTNDSIKYGVKLEPSGGGWKFTSDSWAWTDAKVWVNMSGPSVTLPGDEPIVDGPIVDCSLDPESCIDDAWCEGKPWVCVEVRVDPIDSLDPADSENQGLGFGVDLSTAIADGENGYDVIVYLKDENGDPLVDSDEVDLDSFKMKFSWKDTVKLDQLTGKKGSYDKMENPVQTGGAVIFKPIDVAFKDLTYIGNGAYKLKKGKIKAIAPTSNMNVSKIENTAKNSAFMVRNGVFIWPLSDSKGGQIWTNNIESNDLILQSITYSLSDASGNPVLAKDDGTDGDGGMSFKYWKPVGGEPVQNTVLHANGSAGLSLGFRPPVEVDTLYADNKKDIITAYRDLPFWLTMKAREIGDAVFVSEPQIETKINYSIAETLKNGLCPENAGDFDIHFVDDASKSKTFALSALSKAVSFSAIAEIDGSTCSYAKGPTVYNEVSYTATVQIPSGVGVPDDISDQPAPSPRGNPNASFPPTYGAEVTGGNSTPRQVKAFYYNNMIPKVAGSEISNTQIYVSGTIKGNSAYNPASDVEAVTTSGNVNVNIIRDTIYENLNRYSKTKITKEARLCTISALGATASVSGCVKDTHYTVFDVGNEHIFYTKSDLSLNFTKPTWTGKWIVVSDGGYIYIDGDIYNGAYESQKNHLSLVALRAAAHKVGESGNAYIHPDVKNIQASIVLDGTLMSYYGTKGDFDSEGIPKGNVDDLLQKLQNQLLIEGNLFSRNTIGGFNYSVDHGFKLRGSGELVLPKDETPELLYKVMMEDANFLRLFKLEVQVDPGSGLPIDQSCGMALTSEQTKAILDGESVVNKDNGKSCDGIDVTAPWIGGGVCPSQNIKVVCGDLHIDNFDGRRAKGVLEAGLSSADASKPVFVIYKKISDSIIFSKKGAVSL